MEVVDCVQLENNWKSLTQSLKNERFDYDLFCDTFSQTYQLFIQSASNSHIEKKFLSILIYASLFAHTEISNTLDSKYKAVLALTERMLDTVMKEDAARDEVTIYILELRQEVCINFNHINESIDTLAKIYESDYWSKFGA